MASTWTLMMTVLAVTVAWVAAATSEETAEVQRATRSFPYSLAILRAMRPPQEGEFGPKLIYPSLPASEQEREIADIIESLDADLYGRERRSAPILKRYACRFKFCRIFDA